MTNNKKTLVFVVILSLLCLLCLFFFIFSYNSSARCAYIYVNNELYETIYLSHTESDKEIIIETQYGINVVEISDGRICVSQADCPDKTCVNTGWVSSSATPIICVPHRVEIIIDDITRIDGVTG